jgi:hypothetical protein
MREKGSKTAMIRLVKSDDFIKTLNRLIKTSGASITEGNISIPNAQTPNKEVTLSTFLRQNFDSKKADEITEWWIKVGTATPKWDFISTCTIDGKTGILLVEAKAHHGELKKDKKLLKKDASSETLQNHDQIALAINDANEHIQKGINSITLSRDTCYQFSNRVAHAWWLANHGIPVVLLYLGFLNCEDLNVENKKNQYKLFTSNEDWETCFINHTKIVGAAELINKTIDCGEGSFVTICGSIEIGEK